MKISVSLLKIYLWLITLSLIGLMTALWLTYNDLVNIDERLRHVESQMHKIPGAVIMWDRQGMK